MSIVNANGTFVLFFANLISKILGAFYRLPLSNILGAEGMGLYQMAFPIYSFLLTFITGGISITLTRKIASLRATNNNVEISKQFALGRNSSLFLGIIFLLLLIIFAYPISLLQGNLNVVYGYFAISVGFVFACLLGAYRGYYQGYSRMIPTAISQVIEQGTKLLLGLIFAFIFLKRGLIYGVFGALVGVSCSEIVAYLYFKIINKKNMVKSNVKLTKLDYKQFIIQVMPVSVTYMMMPLSSLLDSFLVVNLLTLSGFLTPYATSLYGIETGMILPLINLPNVLVSALALTCLPDISYKISKKQSIEKQVGLMFKIVLLFILPCSVGLFLLAKPTISLIFPSLDGEMLNIAVNLLRFSVFEMFLLSFVTISNSLLQALGKIKTPVVSLGTGICVKFFVSLLLISNEKFNIYGLVVASVICYFVTAVINVKTIKKHTNFNLKIIEILSPIIASAVMTMVILGLNYIFNFVNSVLGLLVLITISIIVYFSCLVALKQINIKEIKKVLQIKGEKCHN